MKSGSDAGREIKLRPSMGRSVLDLLMSGRSRRRVEWTSRSYPL